VVLAGYQAFFSPPAPTPLPTPTPPAVETGPSSATAPAPSVAGVPAATPLVADTAQRDIVVDTDSVRAVFSTAGATLKSWRLKGYLEGGAPLELVPADIPDSFPRPFTMATSDPATSKTLATALYRPSADGLTLGAMAGQLSFEYRDESGLSARKTFYFQPEMKSAAGEQPERQRYVLRVEAAVDKGGASSPVTLVSGPAIGLGYQPDGSRSVPSQGVLHLNGKVQRLTASSLQRQARYEGDIKFAGVEDQYFLNAALPASEKVSIEYLPITLPVPGDPKGQTRTFINYTVSGPGSLAVPFFIGPKHFETLRHVDPNLELVRAIDFGMFAAIVVPLLQTLNWIHGFVGNYGWAIVVLTLLINLAIFPLRHKSMVSMKKMQAVQPEVKAIQDRYAKYKLTDPERQKMNQEMMALYKQRGVNPVSGCLPMLLTMPILFAFYAMLSAAIEMRGAPFIGWLTDLSRHDPYYVTPVLMGLSMLWQQRMMPTTADPIQQKMFLMMPVIFTVSFLWAPAGLVVYWFFSNLLAIGQQFLTNRLIASPGRTSGRIPAAGASRKS